jgi:hypothetical protein
MPIGRIFLVVSMLGLIGLCVGLVIGAAIFLVPTIGATAAGILIYRKVQLRRRLARFGE